MSGSARVSPGSLGPASKGWVAAAGRLRGGPALGFGTLHATNTLLNMGFTLVQLLVLARILPLQRYSEIVFLMSVSFYFQPFNQAVGKANFVTLSQAVTGTERGRPEPAIVLAGQAAVLLLASLALPCAVAAIGTGPWAEDVLFLFLCLAINFWAFDLQSTAWSLGLNLAFVRLSLVHRGLHMGALVVAFLTKDFLLFGMLATVATLGCVAAAWRLLARAGLFARRPTGWRAYLSTFRTAFLSTLTDFLVMNAPYGLIAARFGLGPMLIVFDSVMKLARVTLAGSRTLAEIALPRHTRLLAEGDRKAGRRLFLIVLALCLGASLVPAATVALAGPAVFKLLLGANDVVPAAAMIPAAIVIMGCSLYQPAVFFLGYGRDRDAVQTLTVLAFVALLGFAAVLHGFTLDPAAVLTLFGAVLAGLGLVSVCFTNALFSMARTPAAAGPSAMLQRADLIP